jgi:hypothetical protein
LDKLARLIGVHLTSGLHDGGIAEVAAAFCKDWGKIIRGVGIKRCVRFGGFNIFSALIQVTFDHGEGLWWVFGKGFGSEPREIGNISFLERSRKSGQRWGE